MVGMRHFQYTFETRKRSFISTPSTYMTVPLKQQIAAVTVFSQAEVGKSETLFKSKFPTVAADFSEVFILYLPHLPVQNIEGCSYLLNKASLDKSLFEDSTLEESN